MTKTTILYGQRGFIGYSYSDDAPPRPIEDYLAMSVHQLETERPGLFDWFQEHNIRLPVSEEHKVLWSLTWVDYAN